MSNIIKGLVIQGLGEGRILGYPTANLKLTVDSFRPVAGVYLATINGLQPTPLYGLLVSGVYQETGNEPRIEVYIIDWQDNIYGRNLEIKIESKLRDLVFTNDPDELKAIIKQDVEFARKAFKL